METVVQWLREVRRFGRWDVVTGNICWSENVEGVCVMCGGWGEGVVSNSNDSLPWTIDDNHNSGHTWSCRSTFVICTQNRKVFFFFFFWAYEFPIQMYSKAVKLVESGRVGKTLDWGKRTRVSMGFEFRSRELPPPFPAPRPPPGALSLLSRSMVGSEFCSWTYASP